MKELLLNKDFVDLMKYLVDRTSKEALIEFEMVFKRTDSYLVFIYFSGHGKKTLKVISVECRARSMKITTSLLPMEPYGKIEEASIEFLVGGIWYCSTEFCCSADSSRREPESRFGNRGFRLLREL